MKNYLVIVSGDINDADIVRSATVINDIELFKRLVKSFKTIVKTAPPTFKYDTHTYLDTIDINKEWADDIPNNVKEDFEFFMDQFCPGGIGDTPVHTITRIEYYELVNPEPVNLLYEY